MGNVAKGTGFLGGFILGGILGGLIGGIAGFLLSQKGEKSTLKVRLSELVAQGRRTISEAIEEGKEAALKKEADIRSELGKNGQ